MRTKLAFIVVLAVAGVAVAAAAQPSPTSAPAPAPAAAAAPAPAAAAPAPAAAAAPAPAAAAAPAAPVDPTYADAAIAKPTWVGSPGFCYDGKVHKWFERRACEPWDTGGSFWMPKGANAAADGTDVMFYATLGLSIFCFFGVTAATIYFVIRYRHRPGHKAEPSAAHNDTLELTWTILPTIIVVFLFLFGWRDYVEVVTPPVKAVEVQVLAQQWSWQFTHQNGVSDNILYVPLNTPVRLVMTSKDVIHSFYAPVMRTKQDVVPKRYTFAWFQATKPGTYRLYCAEYCGGQDVNTDGKSALEAGNLELNSGHSQMKTILVVLRPGEYERYLNDAADTSSIPPAELGAKLYEKKGCIGCHTVDGSPKVGPTWKGDFGSKATLDDGSTITVDDNYIRESILSPSAKARSDFASKKGTMPSFEGQLKENEIQALIAYIKSLK